jgi:endoglycosylceramidase
VRLVRKVPRSSGQRWAVTAIALIGALLGWPGAGAGAASTAIPGSGTAPTGVKPPGHGPLLPLSNSGRWLTDANGRVVIQHGFNMVYKLPPYQPAAAGFDAADADFLARHGFNTVRLGLIYKAVEPTPGKVDHDYIRKVRSIERMLARHGITSLIDFHQDLYNEKFSGEGWPDWAVLDDGLPAGPLSGFPATYLTSPGLNRAFDNFYANDAGPGGVGLIQRFGAAWKRVAASFRGDKGVLGYDLLNEPWPGSGFADCFNIAGCPAFDRNELAPFYRSVIGRIREADRSHLVFYEPNVLFNFDANTNLPDLGYRHLGFSFHNYCFPGLVGGAPPTCPEGEDLVFKNADSRAKATGDALMLSEFGATADTSILDRITGYADRHMVSWQEWHYCGCDDPTTQGPGDTQALVKDLSKPPRGANVFHAKLKALARPYPQAIAGTPIRFGFDPATRKFELVYTRKRVNGNGSFRRGYTDIFVPKLQYPDGVNVSTDGGSVTGLHQHFYVRPHPGAKRIKLVISPQ